jgi:hypothetical protein
MEWDDALPDEDLWEERVLGAARKPKSERSTSASTDEEVLKPTERGSES